MMSAKDRRGNEVIQMRQAILEAAREIAAEVGWREVTVRKVAEKVEYSPATLYEYFASKEAILLALMQEGFRILAQDMRAVPESGNAVERLIAVAQSYWDFAFQYPELYQVMHGLGGVSFGTAETPQEAKDGFVALREAVRAVFPGDGASQLDLYDEVDTLWATLHGLVSLTMADRIKDGRERAATLVLPAVNVFVASWQTEEGHA
jgi:AcrR family transcriptional regulator